MRTLNTLISHLLLLLILSSFGENHTYAADINSPKSYTLSDLCVIALEASEYVRLFKEDVRIALKDKKRALSTIHPSISVFAEYTNLNETTQMFPQTQTYGAQASYTFTLNGRELTALKIASQNIESDEFNLEHIKEDYVLQVAVSYYEILKALKLREIIQADINRLTKHKAFVQSRFDVGEVIKTDLLRASAQLHGASSNLVKADNLLKYKQAVIKSLVPLPEGFNIVESDIPAKQKIKYSLDIVKNEAVSNRPDLLAIKKKWAASSNMAKWYRGAYFPAVSIQGQYFNTSSEWEKEKPESLDADGFSVTGNIIFSLYDGGLKSAELSQAKAKEKKAKLNIELKKKEVLLEVESAWLELNTQISILKSLEEQLNFSKENFRAITEQFKIGLSNSIDVMDANTLLVRAERELSDAKYQYKISELRLQRAKGSLLDTLGIK